MKNFVKEKKIEEGFRSTRESNIFREKEKEKKKEKKIEFEQRNYTEPCCM